MPDEPVIHFVNLCGCDQCAAWREAEADDQLWKQLYWHEREEDICCGDCPECWHHY